MNKAVVNKSIDCRLEDGIMQLHDELLAHAKSGGVYLSSTDCRRMAVQLVYEIAKNPKYKIVPMPFFITNEQAANSNFAADDVA